MTNHQGPRIGFLKTVRLLFGVARRRAHGRKVRQRQLWQQKTQGQGVDWGSFGNLLSLLVMCLLHGLFAFGMKGMVEKAQVVELERGGRIVLEDYAFERLQRAEREVAGQLAKLGTVESELSAATKLPPMKLNVETVNGPDKFQEPWVPLDVPLKFETPNPEVQVKDTSHLQTVKRYAESSLGEARKEVEEWPEWAANSYVRQHGGKLEAAEALLKERMESQGSAGFVALDDKWIAHGAVSKAGTMSLLIVLLMLGWWFVMIACQGEGMDLDFQRRRHPMWEWLLGHPVHPGAVFMAEMLAPLVANPMYLMAPVFWGVVFGNLHGMSSGLLAMGLIGVPVTISLACVGKALEIGAMLRLSMRSRGAVLGIISWLGYVSMVTAFVLPQLDRLGLGVVRLLEPLSGLGSFRWVQWLLGFDMEGNPSLNHALAVYWPLAGLLCAGAVGFSAWATRKGLAGGFGSVPVPAGAVLTMGVSTLSGDPLFKKELLWFKRDRGAVIQVILIPVSMAAFQLFNYRMALEHVLDAWHWLCGAAVLFGTYFLFILGPRSLVSEGPALWIAWTWPRGMEELLKAKAKLWSMLASGLVFLVLLIAIVLFPADWWRVGLVGVGWFLFSHSLAQKAVTLVTKPSDSGEAEPIPRGRQWAASLGTFTFSIGVLTQQWSLAVVGVVYSWITAAAMWQNFRARLPFLYDPWSERLPRPPTLMHAMVAISAMLEVMAVVIGLMVIATGPEQRETGQAIGYAVTALITWIVMNNWLGARGVPARQVWTWHENDVPMPSYLKGLAKGALGGLALAGLAMLYLKALMWFPDLAEPMLKMEEHLVAHPAQRWWLGFTAVICAPLAEEYLFRGLLYRALDREWGGWRAVLASAGFFAIYHPVTSWLPVAAVGVACALLFKQYRRLWPCVVLHTVYNAVVVFWT